MTALTGKTEENKHPADGGKRANRLVQARSPYLLQHAYNPVEWYEWSQEAFDTAMAENRPLLVSIGYATCHWCHVMAHESFEDEDVAALLNRHFVCIKVDREERPDIDDFYMTVSQLMTGSGGWPLNIFMTPDKRPFFAMTYLPKRSRQGMNGFMDLLANIATLWRQNPDAIEKNCTSILKALGNINQGKKLKNNLTIRELDNQAFKQLNDLYDPKWGGFGTSPKFPMPIYVSWLIEQGAGGNETALDMAQHTLRRIRSGGIWDQVGGGLHRYSVDREWLVPHFEKMLYDQALVALSALEAFQATQNPYYHQMAMNIFDFAERELSSPAGGFFSALDADSEGVEGKFYVWDKREIEEVLGDDAPLFCRFFAVTDVGNFEGHTILNAPRHLEEFCTSEHLDCRTVGQQFDRCRSVLLERRNRRIRPFRDEKIVTSWNGLMIAALARGGVISADSILVERASQAAAFVLEKLRRKDGRLLRSFLGEASDTPAFLEDHAFLMFGLLELFEATLDPNWLTKASDLADQTAALFRDPVSGTFSKTGHDAEQMLLKASLEHDGVTPSAFSMTARSFIRLAREADRPDLLNHARTILQTCLAEAQQQPTTQLGSLQALAMLDNDPFEAHFKGHPGNPLMRVLLQQVKKCHIPNLAVIFSPTDSAPTVSICASGTCHPAANTDEELDAILSASLGRAGIM